MAGRDWIDGQLLYQALLNHIKSLMANMAKIPGPKFLVVPKFRHRGLLERLGDLQSLVIMVSAKGKQRSYPAGGERTQVRQERICISSHMRSPTMELVLEAKSD